MTPHQLEIYSKEAKQIVELLPFQPEAINDLLKLIQINQELSKGSPPYLAFFKGEQAYYEKTYEKAIKHYLEATLIPKYQFYCYRASSQLAKERGNLQQASNFAVKALRLIQGDPSLEEVIKEIKQLKTFATSTQEALDASSEISKAHRVSLGDMEIQALTNIFQDNLQQEEELFARDIPTSPSHNPSANYENTSIQSQAWHSTQSLATETTHQDNFTESTMNIGSDIFSSPKQQESSTSEALTQRLYALNPTTATAPNTSTQKALEELKRLAIADTKNEIPTANIAREYDGGMELEQRIQSFQKSQSTLMQNYLELTQKRPKLLDNALYILSGWNVPPQESSLVAPLQFNPSLLTEESRKSSGGHFLRWNGKGIVLNPGAGFIDNFHRQGLSIKDIDFVIVTRDHQEAYADIKKIYELNFQLNKTSTDLQIIHYYLNQKAFRDLSSVLKPHFKQARHTIHSLEMFLDSPDVEKVELTQGIVLNYFLATQQNSFYRNDDSKDSMTSRITSTLGIRLDLSRNDERSQDRPSVRFGYLSGTGWSPLLSHHLGHCDVVLAGFGNTNPNDYTKLGYNEDSLGYHGTFTLLEEVSPKLFLNTEYGGREGDIRIEVLKKIRNEFTAQHSQRHSTVILAADIGLQIDLRNLQIKCSVSQAYVEPSKIHVVKSSESFGRLHYLSPSYCI